MIMSPYLILTLALKITLALVSLFYRHACRPGAGIRRTDQNDDIILFDTDTVDTHVDPQPANFESDLHDDVAYQVIDYLMRIFD